MLIILLKLQNEFKNLNFHVVFFNQFNFAFFYQIHVEFYINRKIIPNYTNQRKYLEEFLNSLYANFNI